MKKESKRSFCTGVCMLAAFVLWTLALQRIDVQTIGPRESAVGFATLNRFVHDLTGVHMSLYTVTDWLGLVPVCFGLGFAVAGLAQWIRRKHIRKPVQLSGKQTGNGVDRVVPAETGQISRRGDIEFHHTIFDELA